MRIQHKIPVMMFILLIGPLMIGSISHPFFKIGMTQSPGNRYITTELSIPITISSNDDFGNLGFPGEGTPENPYRIEGLTFLVNYTGERTALTIHSTNASFIIQNCNFTGELHFEDDWFVPYNTALNMWDVRNGVITNNTFQDMQWCIITSNCTDLMVEDNSFIGAPGVDVHHHGYGVDIQHNLDVSGQIIVNNNYFENLSTAVKAPHLRDFIVSNNEIYTCSVGIGVDTDSFNGTVQGNSVEFNSYTGISCAFANNITILNNTCADNRLWGIEIVGSENITVSYNVLLNNGNTSEYSPESRARAIQVDVNCRNNVVTMNDLIYNYRTIDNDDSGNTYDLNYYSDYDGVDGDGDNIGDTPYDIDGDSPTSDQHPRMLTISDYLLSLIPTTTTNTTTNTTTGTSSQPAGTEMIFIVVGLGAVGVTVVLAIFMVKSKK